MCMCIGLQSHVHVHRPPESAYVHMSQLRWLPFPRNRKPSVECCKRGLYSEPTVRPVLMDYRHRSCLAPLFSARRSGPALARIAPSNLDLPCHQVWPLAKSPIIMNELTVSLFTSWSAPRSLSHSPSSERFGETLVTHSVTHLQVQP